MASSPMALSSMALSSMVPRCVHATRVLHPDDSVILCSVTSPIYCLEVLNLLQAFYNSRQIDWIGGGEAVSTGLSVVPLPPPRAGPILFHHPVHGLSSSTTPCRAYPLPPPRAGPILFHHPVHGRSSSTTPCMPDMIICKEIGII